MVFNRASEETTAIPTPGFLLHVKHGLDLGLQNVQSLG